MKKIISVLLGSALLLTACGSSSAAVNLGVEEFQSKVQESGVVTIDVRTPFEYMTGHIEGSINIDAEADSFESEIAKLDKTATYAIYCQSGRRSGIAAGKMTDLGFTNLFNLQAGINDWNNAGYPVVTN
jgi:phage shock protein E